MTEVSDRTLLALLDGSLSPEEEQGLADLVAGSPELEARLARLSGASSFDRDFETAHRRDSAHPGKTSSRITTVYHTLLEPSGNSDSLGRIDGYEILEHIASGGMGVIFKARDPELERIVALKVLSPTLAASDDARRRFTVEAQAIASLDHPNIIPIYAVQSEANPPYIVMRYIEGESLQDRLDANKGNPLPLHEVLEIARSIASALAAAHQPRALDSSQSGSALSGGLIHRDIKPSNVLLERPASESGAPGIYLTDFGLARPLEPGSTDLGLTRTGQFLGTPQDMSPEQATGARNIDHRTDLFSFGALLYAAATGSPPFRGDSFPELAHEITESAPARPRDLNRSLPAWFANLIDRLLAKRPDDRPHSAAEIVTTIEDQANLGTLSLTRLVGRRTRLRRRLAYAAQAVFAAVLGIGALALALDVSGKTAIANLLLSKVTGRAFSIENDLAVFSDLATAAAAAEPGDTIVVRGKPGFELREPVTLPAATPLTIRGVPGQRTAIRVMSDVFTPTIKTTSPLVLRDLVLVTNSRPNPPPLVESRGATLDIENCWLVRKLVDEPVRLPSNPSRSLLRFAGSRLAVTDSILFPFDITSIIASPPPGGDRADITFDNVFSFGAHGLFPAGAENQHVAATIRHSRLGGARPFNLANGGAGPTVSINASDSMFEDVRVIAALEWDADTFRRKITWEGNHNRYTVRHGIIGGFQGTRINLPLIKDLSAWRKFSGSAENNSTYLEAAVPRMKLFFEASATIDLEAVLRLLEERDTPDGLGPDPARLGPR